MHIAEKAAPQHAQPPISYPTQQKTRNLRRYFSSNSVPNDDQSAEQPSAILIPVQVEHVDQLIHIARDLSGFILILDAAAIGDPALAAVERILSQINDQLQEFKSWFHDAWRVANAGSGAE